MPDESPVEPLDWTEANLSHVVSQIYAKAAGDQAFYNQLMSEPYAILSTYIQVPDDYNQQVFARQKNRRMFILNVPPYGETVQAAPGATETMEMPIADYVTLCTGLPPW